MVVCVGVGVFVILGYSLILFVAERTIERFQSTSNLIGKGLLLGYFLL